MSSNFQGDIWQTEHLNTYSNQLTWDSTFLRSIWRLRVMSICRLCASNWLSLFTSQLNTGRPSWTRCIQLWPAVQYTVKWKQWTDGVQDWYLTSLNSHLGYTVCCWFMWCSIGIDIWEIFHTLSNICQKGLKDIKQVWAIVAAATAGWDATAMRRAQLNDQDIGPILQDVVISTQNRKILTTATPHTKPTGPNGNPLLWGKAY